MIACMNGWDRLPLLTFLVIPLRSDFVCSAFLPVHRHLDDIFTKLKLMFASWCLFSSL